MSGMKGCRNLWLFMIAGMQILRDPLGALAADNPCPGVFRYEGSSGSEYGIITVPSPYPYIAVEISVAIYITAQLPRTSHIKLEPVDKDMWWKLAGGSRDPILYRIDFPVSSPLPTIKSITVNQYVICRGTKPDSTYLTTMTVKHAVFNKDCHSASLECPDNMKQSPGTISEPPQSPIQTATGGNIGGSSPPTSPCPDVFRYERDSSGDWHGIISVPNPYPVVAIDIRVEVYVAALASSANGRFGLVNNLNEEWTRMRTGERYSVQYRLDFPLRSPLPTVKSIIVNNRLICSGSQPNALTLSTLSYQHGMFNQDCTSASLDCPGNIVGSRPPEGPVVEPTRPNPPLPPPTVEPTPAAPPPPPPVITTKPTQPPSGSDCGLPVVRTNALVFGGWVTEHGAWPWHVALYQHTGYDTIYRCGGSFVGTRTIITAAHCFHTPAGERLPDEDFTVSLGRYNLKKSKEEGAQEKDVSRIFVHPAFNFSVLEADVGIVVLSSIVQITTQVRPVCLWSQRDKSLESIIDRNGTVAGWGLDEKGMTAEMLKMVNMPVVSQETCLFSHQEFFKIYAHKTTFCAGLRNGNSVCNGDSGGGLMFQDGPRGGGGVWRIRGIVSNSREDDFVKRRCDLSSYILFTDLAPYLGWIENLLF